MDKSTLFPTDFKAIQSRLLRINPVDYSKTRNYLNGNTTLISPYLTHGVVSTRDVAHTVLSRYNKREAFTFIFELAWREYLHMVWFNFKNIIEEDIDCEQDGVVNRKLLKCIVDAQTGIDALDLELRNLYSIGHMHNQARLWLASLVCNIAKTHWKLPSKWLYYNSLDGDIAINILSWQTVAGTFNNNKYYFNQDIVNKYHQQNQINSFIDKPISEIKRMSIPRHLQEAFKDFEFITTLPQSQINEVDPQVPVLFYSIWNLKPNWHSTKNAQRILVLEPSHFNKYPMNKKRIDFIMQLAKNIPELKIYTGEICNLKNLNRCKDIISIQYPTTEHWPGKKEYRSFIFENLMDKYRTFDEFWNDAEKEYANIKI